MKKKLTYPNVKIKPHDLYTMFLSRKILPDASSLCDCMAGVLPQIWSVWNIKPMTWLIVSTNRHSTVPVFCRYYIHPGDGFEALKDSVGVEVRMHDDSEIPEMP